VEAEARTARAHALIQTFLAFVRARPGHELQVWTAEARHGGLETLARFARGRQEDLAAPRAGLRRLPGAGGVPKGEFPKRAHAPPLQDV
jgi:hypothetical protein